MCTLLHVQSDLLFLGLSAGEVGITLDCDWFDPQDPVNQTDIDAADRAMQFFLGWFAHPVFVNGDYPEVMKEFVKDASLQEGLTLSRLPEFTDQEKQRIKGKIWQANHVVKIWQVTDVLWDLTDLKNDFVFFFLSEETGECFIELFINLTD